jgi:hypothetical protein
VLIAKRYGDDAIIEAAQRADQLQEDGDWQGAITWHRILDCIERIQARKPAEGEKAALLATRGASLSAPERFNNSQSRSARASPRGITTWQPASLFGSGLLLVGRI